MKAGDLQRYKGLLSGKRGDLLAEFDTKTLAPAARASEGDMLDQARARRGSGSSDQPAAGG